MRLRSLGLMSGTSMDGIDVALLETDGETVVPGGPTATVGYDDSVLDRLRYAIGEGKALAADARRRLVTDITDAHADAAGWFLQHHGYTSSDIDVVAFPGHTLFHHPDQRETYQIGDERHLTRRLGIDVVGGFRSADVAAGGQGGPLDALYHAAVTKELRPPVAVVTIGGISSVTYVGADGVLAFDTGPGNALIDTWISMRTGERFDFDGIAASRGQPDDMALQSLLADPYFERPPPKSVDRLDFTWEPVAGATLEDGAATLTALVAQTIARAAAFFPKPPRRWLISGGGRRNAFLMATLRRTLGGAVDPIEILGGSGDAIEAKAFAFLAVRTLRGLPTSLPSTTGVLVPTVGGRIHHAAESET